MMKRRDALRTIGGLAGAASLSRLLPACGDDENGQAGITTYVYLMLENRTYDHVFGARKLAGLPGDGLAADMRLPDLDGNLVAPYVPVGLEECAPDPQHEWDPSHEQWNNGAMDNFLRVHQTKYSRSSKESIQYMTRNEMPVSWALADAYTSCDRWFASVMGPTFPNRAFWHCGTSFGLKDNQEIISTLSSNGLPAPSIYNRLADAGVDWAFYYGSYPVAALLTGAGPYQLDVGPSDGTGRIRRFGDPVSGTGQFFKDAAAGKLPPVTYIDPAYDQNDDHPPLPPILAQSLVASIYRALAKSPQWKNLMFVITYDEHGGFFDHVPPPRTTDDTLEKFGVDGFQQMGFRVPGLVIGPYAKQSYVSSVQYDHTSALKHLTNAFGLEPLNPRVAAANDLSDCIDMDRLARGEPAAPIEIPEIDLDSFPHMDPSCHGAPSFRTQSDLHKWMDANPGKWDPAYDLRGTDQMSVIVDFLRKDQGGR